MDVEKALAHWRSQGLLSREQAERLEASLEELQEEPLQSGHRDLRQRGGGVGGPGGSLSSDRW